MESTQMSNGKERLALWAALGLFLSAILLPLLPFLLWSFTHRWFFPTLLPEEWSLRAWRYVLSDNAQVGNALLRSTFIGAGVTLLSLIIGLPAGRALGLFTFRGKTVAEFLFLAPTIVPALAAAMGIHVIFVRYGLADSVPGVVFAHLIPVTPYVVLILAGVFAGYEAAFEDQARSLGAGPFQVLVHVTLPLIAPGLAVAALFAFLISWSQYLLTLLIGGGQVLTLPVLLFSFATSGDLALTAVLSLILFAPALLGLFLASRFLSGSTVVGGLGRL